ncbi:LAFE_0D04148g1_1 [Lachancea fermentati]|uniref:LAFE_0D04148g1_1 n=1 Tax=Lachancea fermentati TaxID=4955 RepID=A0A1G4MB79_LACFM|nr:LAFE_0D04148g1_1 [Lachancea fermentati]
MPTLRCRGEKRATVWVLVHRSSGHRPRGHRSVPLQRDAGLGPLRRARPGYRGCRPPTQTAPRRPSRALRSAAEAAAAARHENARCARVCAGLRVGSRGRLWAGRAATEPSAPRGRARSKSEKLVPSVSDLAIVAPPVANVKRSGAQISGKG